MIWWKPSKWNIYDKILKLIALPVYVINSTDKIEKQNDIIYRFMGKVKTGVKINNPW